MNNLDPGGSDTVVTDKENNELFTLDDGKEEVTRITAKDAYQQGIQWFEEVAELTAKTGTQFSEGKIIQGVGAMLGAVPPDASNTYDNHMIARVTKWAEYRWRFTLSEGAGIPLKIKTEHLYRNLRC